MELHIPSDAEAGPLIAEVRTLRKNITEVLKHSGEWVLIQGDQIAGYHPSFATGITDGYKQFGLNQFMVTNVDELTKPRTFMGLRFTPAILA